MASAIFKTSRRLGGAVPVFLACAAIISGSATAETATETATKAPPIFTPILDTRLRYESVDQEGFAKDANAVTLRFRFGLESRSYNGFSALVEGEGIEGLNNDYNSTTNGRTALPVVADPDSIELNRAHIAYADADVKAVVGRQRIILDNARFVGNVGWRQNEQTFDAALGLLTVIPDLRLTYAYISAVRRVFSSRNPAGKFDSDSHLVNLNYTGLWGAAFTGYGYLLDLKEAPASSTATYGLRGTVPIDFADGALLQLTGEYAFQTDYSDNAGDVDLSYFLVSIGTKFDGFDASVTHETLEGNGGVGFATPLATLHEFQGWADVFLTTPASGIEDRYGRIGYAFREVGPFAEIVTAAIYHDYKAEIGGSSLGNELNLLIKGVIDPKLSATFKFATYDGPAGGPADRNKLWLQFDHKF